MDNISILEKAESILKNLGHSVYIDDYYSDIYNGETFEYDKLKIYQDKNKNISIKINNEDVFNYVFKTNTIERKNGEWPELILAIYEEIPSILEKRRKKREAIDAKVSVMKKLESFLVDYINVYNKNSESVKLANTKLLNNEIEVKKETRYYTTFNPIQCYDEEHEYNVFVITYKGQPVMEFMDNIYHVLPDFNYEPGNNEYVQKFKVGDWVSIFAEIMLFVNQFDEKYTECEIDNSAKEMIKSFKRKNRDNI